MPTSPTNEELAATLEEYAALLELSAANAHATRAFRRAATLIRGTPADVAALVREGRVRSLRGIGPGIEQRLQELVGTGRIAELDELRRSVSLELAAFGRMHGFAARRFVDIGAALGIHTVAELRDAAARGRLREVRGIGAGREAAILAALDAPPVRAAGTLLLHRAQALCERIADALGGVAAGDPRRWKDAPRSLAVVVATDAPDDVRTRFAALPEVVALVEPSIGVSVDGTPVELVTAPTAEFGTALVRATGSAEYVAGLGPLPSAADEETVYRLLGRPYVPPELREEHAAATPADLIELPAIRGDLHCHTTWSDGRATVRELAEAAIARGYQYVAVCDHTTNVSVVPGLDADALRRQAAEIAAVNAAVAPFRVLRGVECDILPDGRLDLPDDVLAELDWVQISLHAGQRAPRTELTARVMHAMHHPAARCLSHPTGRIIGHRPENRLDLERTIETALETGVALEVNGLPSRLDLSGEHVREVIAAGVHIVCSSDAHSAAGLDSMSFSVHTARRGGAPRAAVVNTRMLHEPGGPLASERR
ncbi:MAG: PHP domain-containing protein [Gaiellales bacterium]